MDPRLCIYMYGGLSSVVFVLPFGADVTVLSARYLRDWAVDDRSGAVVLHDRGAVCASVLGIRLVAVHALHLDRHAVHEERVADDLLLLEADLPRADVIALLHDERVEIGILGAPEPRFELELEVGVGEGNCRFFVSKFLTRIPRARSASPRSGCPSRGEAQRRGVRRG